MTRLSGARIELLSHLARMPFLDRLELAALAGRSRGGVYEAVGRLEDAGLIASVPHGTPLLAPTRRHYLTRQGVNALALEEARPVDRLLRDYPLSLRWRRVLLERLDAAAVVYRLACALAGLGHLVGFRWQRALPQDAAVVLPDDRVLAIVRQGATTERAGFAKRLWRLAQGPRPGAVLVLVPDEVRLRQAVATLRGARPAAAPVPAFFALERHAASAGAGDPIWRSLAGAAAVSLAEAVGRANPGGVVAVEPPLVRVSIPRDIGLGEFQGRDPGQDVADHLLPVLLRPAEKRALDLLADWPWLAREDLAGLLGASKPRASQLTAALERLGLATAVRRGARRLALTDRGLKLLARRDRVSTGEARQRWSVSADNDGASVSGRRSRQLLRDLEHTAAVHRFVAALVRQAHNLGWEVEQLDPPHRASRYFRHYGGPRSLHPDAFGTLRRNDLLRPFFLEYERRAVRPATMAQRLAPYLRYYSSHRPADDHGQRPLAGGLRRSRRSDPLPGGGPEGDGQGTGAATPAGLPPATGGTGGAVGTGLAGARRRLPAGWTPASLQVNTTKKENDRHENLLRRRVPEPHPPRRHRPGGGRGDVERPVRARSGLAPRHGGRLQRPHGAHPARRRPAVPHRKALPRGCRNRLLTLEEGLEIIMDGLRVLEQAAWRRGGISVINVCRRNSPFQRNRVRDRAAARRRLLELVNDSLAADGRYAHIVEDEERRDGLPALARLSVDPPVACPRPRYGDSGGDAAPDTAVCAPPHRVAGDDELLQLAGLVSYSLLQQEEPTAMAEALNFHLAFGILKRVLDRRACPQDPQGVDRL